MASPPTRRCGLKLWNQLPHACPFSVTSYAEAWIEIGNIRIRSRRCPVTSYAEVWIEIVLNPSARANPVSHLLRGGVD